MGEVAVSIVIGEAFGKPVQAVEEGILDESCQESGDGYADETIEPTEAVEQY